MLCRACRKCGSWGGTDTKKAVPLDDPQIEFGACLLLRDFFLGGKAHVMGVHVDSRSWRFRCQVMAGISLFTYVPFIVCVAIFA